MVGKSRFLTAEAVRNDNLIRGVWAQLKPVCMTHAEGSNDGDAVSVQRSFASVGMTWELVRYQSSGPDNRRCNPLGEHFADAADLGSDAAQLFFDVLVAAIDVVDAIDDGLAICDQGCNDQRGRCTQV